MATWNNSNPTEASLNFPTAYIKLRCKSDSIVQNGSVGIFNLRILTEVTWSILTATVVSWNIPATYLALSFESEFILTEFTWNIPTTTDASLTILTAI